MKKYISLFIIALFALMFLSSSCRSNLQYKKTDESKLPVPPPSVPYFPNAQKETEVPLRFVVMADSRGSDNGINLQSITKTLEQIKKITPQPAFAFMPGDLVGGAKVSSEVKNQLLGFKTILTKYYPIDFFYPGFGNHEAIAGTGGEEAFKEVFSALKANFLQGYNNTVYYFDNGDARFYMLNSNHPKEGHLISDSQLNWIEKNTDTSKNCNLFFFHEPAYPTGAHVGSSLDANTLQRNKLWKVIDSSTRAMVFCGHEHNYTRRHIDSSFNSTFRGEDFKFKNTVYQVTTGTFGAPFYSSYTSTKNVDVPPITEYHFAIVDISNNKIKVNVYNLDGKIIDSFQQ